MNDVEFLIVVCITELLEEESIRLNDWLSPVMKTTWFRETLLLEHVLFFLPNELLCFPFKKVVFLFRPALRFAIRATDKLLSFTKNLDLPGALESSLSHATPFCLLEESLALFSFASLVLSPIKILPRFLDKDVYRKEENIMLVSY